ncbi:CLAVATA [Trema orientale]|uniref:CLAVATA n=1 Tax=Trema orientale TaxID=63057 RepID=A0A2P5BER2_TREOI|nr:CLAVATA [Trema orientale]
MADCNASGKMYGCFFADEAGGFPAAVSYNRKSENSDEQQVLLQVLTGLKEKKEVTKDGTLMRKSDASSGNGDSKLSDCELRKVPSGPDPLHHNGNGPKKPRSP